MSCWWVMMATLSIERLVESMELTLAAQATLVPGADEAKAVAKELDEGGPNAEKSNLQAFIAVGRVD